MLRCRITIKSGCTVNPKDLQWPLILVVDHAIPMHSNKKPSARNLVRDKSPCGEPPLSVNWWPKPGSIFNPKTITKPFFHTISGRYIICSSQIENSFIENWIRVLATSKASTTFKVVTTNTQFAAADEAGGPTEVERTDIITGRSVGEGMRRQHFKEICTEPEQPWGRKRFHR